MGERRWETGDGKLETGDGRWEKGEGGQVTGIANRRLETVKLL